MKTLCLILLVILVGCSQVEVAKTPDVTPIKPDDVFYTKSSFDFVQKAVTCANLIFKSDQFKALVLNGKYDQTSDKPEMIWQKLSLAGFTEVKTVRSTNPFTNMVAVKYKDDPAIYLNSRKNRSNAEWTGSICHEKAHVMGWTHRGNSPRGNEDTVPYKLGDYCEQLAYLCK
jgi:hypothetical protein